MERADHVMGLGGRWVDRREGRTGMQFIIASMRNKHKQGIISARFATRTGAVRM